MTDTIGRVDFIVSLDGRTLPAQAKLLAEEIGKAGKPAADNFSDEFTTTFNKRLSSIGDEFANRLGGNGKLAGSTFSDDFDQVLQGRFRGMQRELANILSDEGSFRQFASGFDSVDLAVERAVSDLEDLHGAFLRTTDADGNLVDKMVLTDRQFAQFVDEAHRLGSELQNTLSKEKALADQSEALAKETERLEASLQRTVRLVGDPDLFRAYADSVGGTESAFRRLRTEVEGTGTSLGHGRVEIESWLDKLEVTRNTVNKLDNEMKVLEGHPNRIAGLFDTMFQKIGTSWARTDSTVRLVVGLIAGAGDQVAALGSATGAEIVGLGAIIGEGVLGVGALVLAFTALNGKLATTFPVLKPLVQEFDTFKQGLIDVRAEMTLATFSQMEGSFSRLDRSITVITPNLRLLAGSAGQLFDAFTRGLEPGTQGFEQLQGFIDNAARDFPRLGQVAGTWTVALLRGMNEANPLLQQLVNWVDLLGTRFDAFTRSSNFLVWVDQAKTTFGSLFFLIDQLGGALNALSTAKSVGQLNALIDDLARFVPTLGAILTVVGDLNPLGLAVQILADLGDALVPVLPPLQQLATVLGTDLSAAVTGVAHALGILTPVLIPVIDGLTGLISLVPPEAIQALAAALLVFGAEAALASTAVATGNLANKVLGWGDAFLSTAAKIDDGANALQRFSAIAGKLGTLAIVAAVAVGIGTAINQYIIQPLGGWQKRADEAVAANESLVASSKSVFPAFQYLGKTMQGTTLNAGNLVESLKLIAKQDANGGEVFSGWVIGTSKFDNSAADLRATLGQLDAPLAGLAKTDLTAAAGQFSSWATSAHASTAEVISMINSMPQFKQALTDAAQAQGVVATDSNLAQFALQGMSDQQKAAADAAAQHDAALQAMAGTAVTARGDIDALSNAIKGIASTTLDARAAQRDFEAAVQAVTDAVTKSGTSLDITTAAGRANQAALDGVAQAAINNAAAVFKQTGQQSDATAAINAGRDALINQLGKFGIVGPAAQAYADKLGLIPDNINTVLGLNTGPADASLSAFYRNWNGRTVTFNVRTNGDTSVLVNGVARGHLAAGAVVNGAQLYEVGEAGPEAVVPLNRPLSQVDPAVRWLSAIAQGLNPPMASGGVVAGSKPAVLIEAGAITLQGHGDDAALAQDVVNRIFEKVA